jgi:uncharacterized protein (TIGR02391 family)
MELKELIHDRIIDKCLPVYEQGFYEEAATTAMKQVEIALKERTGDKKLFGIRLIQKYLSNGGHLRLVTKIDEEEQKIAKKYFESTFSYYRNYTAHDGRNIDRILSTRILIIASELLELLNASSLSLMNIGGLDKLIENGIYDSRNQLKSILDILLAETIIDDTFDGLWETLYLNNKFSENHFNKLFELGLIQYKTEVGAIDEPETNELLDFGCFELTDIGKNIMKQLSKDTI